MTDHIAQTSQPKRRGLGRGLDALFEDSEKRAAIMPDRTAVPDMVVASVPSHTANMSAPAPAPSISTSSTAQTPSVRTDFDGDTVRASSVPHPSVTAAAMMTGRLMLPVSALCPGINQPRTHFDDKAIEELANSIKIHGIIQPLLVRPIPVGRENWAGAMYEIIAGERRWRAAQRAGVHDIPVVIDADMDDKIALQVGIIENVQRTDLNPIEEAMGYDRLIREFGYSAERVADLIGKSRPHVANLCRLLQLPLSVRAMVVDGQLSAGHARALVGYKNAEDLAAQVIKGKLSVRQTENLVRRESRPFADPRTGRAATRTPTDMEQMMDHHLHIEALNKDMTDAIGLAVDVQMNRKKIGAGIVAISFDNLDQLDLVLARIRGV